MRNKSPIIIIVLFIAFLMAGIHLSTTNQEFSRNNPAWNGTSGFFSHIDRHKTSMISDLSILASKSNTTLLVIAPETVYSESEYMVLRDYCTRNRIIIASDDTIGNQILTGLGSAITVHPGLLGSIDRAYNDSYVVVTIRTGRHQLVQNVTRLVINKGVTLSGGEILIQSSLFSWIDADGDHRVSGGESFGRYPVMSREQRGSGEIIVLSDPSVFINGMSSLGDEWDNDRFILNLLSLDPLIIEQVHSRTKSSGIVEGILYQLRSDKSLEIGFIAVLLIIICLMMHLGVFNDSSGQECNHDFSGRETGSEVLKERKTGHGERNQKRGRLK